MESLWWCAWVAAILGPWMPASQATQTCTAPLHTATMQLSWQHAWARVLQGQRDVVDGGGGLALAGSATRMTATRAGVDPDTGTVAGKRRQIAVGTAAGLTVGVITRSAAAL